MIMGWAGWWGGGGEGDVGVIWALFAGCEWVLFVSLSVTQSCCLPLLLFTVINTWYSSSIGRALDRQSKGSGFGSPECHIYGVVE